ncbi:hypothetical protein [Nocardiopsis oceani]
MIDPTSFGAALTTLLVVAAMVIAFGLAILSDMAMRRREDRADDRAGTTDSAAEDDTPTAELAETSGPAANGASDEIPETKELVASAPTGNATANGTSGS